MPNNREACLVKCGFESQAVRVIQSACRSLGRVKLVRSIDSIRPTIVVFIVSVYCFILLISASLCSWSLPGVSYPVACWSR